MPKIGEARPEVVADARSDSTLDQQTGIEALGAIAREEIDENEALREAIEAQEQAIADAAHAELVAGWQTACQKAAKVITKAFPALRDVWDKESMEDVGEALAECDAYYGWGGVGRLLGHPLAKLAVVSAPVAMGTYVFMQEMKAQRAIAEQQRKHGLLPAMPTRTAPVADKAARMDETLVAA